MVENPRIAVIGDVMLDAYDYAKTRDNPEEDTLCTTTQKITYRLGGAGNVAVNLAKLGVNVFFIARVGDDREGELVKMLLEANLIKNKLIIDKNMTTPLKERTLSYKDGHYHHRDDLEGFRRTRIQNSDGSITDAYGGSSYLKAPEIPSCLRRLSYYPMIIISDYAKGMITDELVQGIKMKNARVLVDTKPAHKKFYNGVWLIKPNSKELREMTGEIDDFHAAEKLHEELECRVLVTRGEEGMHYHGFQNEKWWKLNSRADVKPGEVKDRVGAGDNVIALLAYALNEGYDMRQAMNLASKGAGIAVCHRGCYAPTLRELGL